MTDSENEKLIHYLVVLDKPGRRAERADGARWGEVILPAPSEVRDKKGDGLKILLMGSWQFGYIVLETLKNYERRFPERLNLVGFVTDHPLNPDAKISVKKRIWGKLELPLRVIDETTIIESALCHGVPVYTGEVKTDAFYQLMKQWHPDAIVVCVFGQVINSTIIDFPAYGIYNFHPSDLTRQYGAGPAPYEDLAARRAETTLWSVHHVSEEIDAGQVVGQSPPVKVLNADGLLPGDPLIVYNKIGEALSPLAFFLTDELCRRFEARKTGKIDHIDFPPLFSDEIKSRLLQPVVRNEPEDILLFPDRSLIV